MKEALGSRVRSHCLLGRRIEIHIAELRLETGA